MKLKLIQKKVNGLSILILLVGIIFISGCASQNTDGANQNAPSSAAQQAQGSPGKVSQEISFSPPAELPDGTDYVNYSYSFCQPEPAEGDDCGDYTRVGTTTEPTGGAVKSYIDGTGLVYLFEIKDRDPFLPIYLYSNGRMDFKPILEGTTPKTYPLTICVRNPDTDNAVCKDTSLTFNPKIPDVNYTVSVTVDSAAITTCVPGIASSWGGWELTAEGTMTSNVPFRQGEYYDAYDRGPVANFWLPVVGSAHGGNSGNENIYAENIDCGEWTLDQDTANCEKQEGDPDTTTWRITYSHSIYQTEEVSVAAHIISYNPNYDYDYSSTTKSSLSMWATEKSAGTC